MNAGGKSTPNRFGIPIASEPSMRFLLFAIYLFAGVFGRVLAALPSEAAIPFEYCEGFLWIQVQVPQSAKPLNFIFDTGAGVSVINATTAKQLGLKTGNRVSVQGVHASMTGHWPAKLTATAGGLALPSKYLALDLGKLGHSCGRPLDGLLGADFIQGRIVEIDFEAHRLRFLENVSVANSDTVIPLKVCNDSFCVPIGINNEKSQWMRLDTGCATALQWVTSDVKTRAQTGKPAVGLAAFTIPQATTTVFLGGRRFDQVPTGIHRSAIFPGEAGLLGNGLLDRFKTVTIDAKAQRLILGESAQLVN